MHHSRVDFVCRRYDWTAWNYSVQPDIRHTQDTLGGVTTLIFCILHTVKWWHTWAETKVKRLWLNGCMDEECVNNHVTSQLYSSKATEAARARSGAKASWMTTAWKRYLGHHSQPSNTALWGTQQTGLAFHTRAAALTHNGLYRDGLRLHGSLLFHVHTLLRFMNINLMFT